MRNKLMLPQADGTLKPYVRQLPASFDSLAGPLRSRVAFAAAHVVCNPLLDINPTLETGLDWDTTLAYRRYLWSLGLSVAEAMDTAHSAGNYPLAG